MQLGETSKVPLPTRWGQQLLAICVLSLVFGNAVVAIFFPHRLGKGLDATAFAFLIPIWAIGIVGLMLVLLGWILSPIRDAKLFWMHGEIPLRRNGRYFSPFTRYLAAFTLILLIGGSLMLLFDDEFRLDRKFWMLAIMTFPATFLFYLLVAYDSKKDRAVTTYLNDFLIFLPAAILLVSITWPLLIVFNVRARREFSSKD